MLSPILMLAAAQAALFPAQKLAPTNIERDAQRRALDLIRDTYDYANSTISRHHFVRLAPAALQHELVQVRVERQRAESRPF